MATRRLRDASFSRDAESTESGLSLSDFSKGFTQATNFVAKGIAKGAQATITTAVREVRSLPKKALAIPKQLITKPWTVLTMPAKTLAAPMQAGLRAAGLGAVATLMDSPNKLANTFASASGFAAMLLIRGQPGKALETLKAGAKEMKANPAYNYGLGAVALIPVVGQPVSLGVRSAINVGAGMSLQDSAIAAARDTFVNPLLRAAYDLGTGLARGESLSEAGMFALRSQLPPGTEIAFDVAVLIARRKALAPELLQLARQQYGVSDQQLFDRAWNKAKSAVPNTPDMPTMPTLPGQR